MDSSAVDSPDRSSSIYPAPNGVGGPSSAETPICTDATISFAPVSRASAMPKSTGAPASRV
jgi:hypothetical protein